MDAACEQERQIREFRVMYDIITRTYPMGDKQQIRSFFNELRQKLLDWHTAPFRTDKFEQQEAAIREFYLSNSRQ